MLSSVAVLALAALCALAINDLVHRDVTLGVVLLLAVVALRWALSSVLEEWGANAAERLRVRWREAVLEHVSLPRRSGEASRGDLALAIEQASFAPSMERLAASAATALLGVVVVFLAAGWLPTVITVALVALAAPLYRRAGRRSEERAREYHERRARLEVRQLEVLQHAPELRALGAVEFGATEIAALSENEHVLALRAIRVALESSLVTEFLSGVSIGLVAMVVGFGLLGGRVSLLRALIAVLITSELFVQVRRFGVEFHRRDDAEGARKLLNVLFTPASSQTGTELLWAATISGSIWMVDGMLARRPFGQRRTNDGAHWLRGRRQRAGVGEFAGEPRLGRGARRRRAVRASRVPRTRRRPVQRPGRSAARRRSRSERR